MEKGRTSEKRAIVRKRKGASQSSGRAWDTLRRGLREALCGLEQDEYLILASRSQNYFVQFAGHENEGMRAEAVSNAYLTGNALLSDRACQALQAMGWCSPTYVPIDGAPPPATGSPNFYVDATPPIPFARFAALAIQTLHAIYRVRHPRELAYKAGTFSGGNVSIRFPALTIPRRIEGSDGCGDDTSTRESEVPVPTTPRSAAPPFALPDGQPIASEAVEADLKARVSKCEGAFEDSLWQLARFYSAVGRQKEATECLERCLAATQDQARQAAGCLGLGQLLEQQDRYAEAEAMYARGLEIPVATAEVGYFLHNNRGYCLNLLKRHTEAEAQSRAAIDIDPARHNAHKNLGLALAGQGRLTEAVRCLLEADQRCPGDTRARGHLRALLAENPEVLAADPALAAACRERRIRPGRVASA